MHVIVWGVTDPSKRPIRAVRLPSPEDPHLLAGEFAAIVFCEHFLVNNFWVEVLEDERYHSCGYAVPTPHSSGCTSCEPPLDFATWCYGPLADKDGDTDLTDAYERAVETGEVQAAMNAKRPIHARALAEELFKFAVSPSERIQKECGQNFYIEWVILKLFAVDFVLYLRSGANPMLGSVRAKFNAEIDALCESRPELAEFDDAIADRFQKYSDACKQVHYSKEKNPAEPIHYYVGKTFSSFVKGQEVRDALESTVNDWYFWTMCRDLKIILDSHVIISEDEPHADIN
jgi:hypothetical protein